MKPEDLPDALRRGLELFVEACKAGFAEDLISVILFGSTAEGRHRATSDVNVIVVLKRFEVAKADAIREAYRTAHSAILLNAMFILESELESASDAFAVKFADVQARHRVLFGSDPFATLKPSREALVRRLGQVLGNLALRTRERYVLLSLREEQLGPLVAEMAAPLRSSAAALMNLAGSPARSPRDALIDFVAKFGEPAWQSALDSMSRIREGQETQAGEAPRAVLALMALTEKMRVHADALARDAHA